jgi:hypothetical protein
MSNATYEINIPALNSSSRHCGENGGGYRLVSGTCSRDDRYRIVQEELTSLAKKFKQYLVANNIENRDNGIMLIKQALKKGAITSIQIDSDDPLETSAFMEKYPIFDGFLTNFSVSNEFNKITKIIFQTDLSKFAPQPPAVAGGQRHRYKSHRNYKKSNKRVRSAKRSSASRKTRRQRK